jgi:predicted nucleic acid-binding protein
VKIVLDAWALLSLIFKEEPAAERVKHILNKEEISDSSIYISWINVGEVYYSIARSKGLDVAYEVLNDIKNLYVTLNEPSKKDILAAAILKSKHKLSYADAFAV